jgi:predicted nucleic acid-binding protein
MKQTNDKVFLDTNILVYSYSNNELHKQKIARKLITETNSFISTQVLQEFCNTLTKKFGFSFEDGAKAISECSSNSFLHINTDETILKSCKIAHRYKFSFYDSLIIAAAIECGCTILYSEDLKHQQIINKSITIVNPFLS